MGKEVSEWGDWQAVNCGKGRGEGRGNGEEGKEVIVDPGGLGWVWGGDEMVDWDTFFLFLCCNSSGLLVTA